MSRTGASTPDATKITAAASSRASLLRRASARLDPAASARLDSAAFPAPSPPSFTTPLRIVTGTRFRFLIMPKPEHHLSRYVTEQPSYSILQRGIETHVLPVAEEYGMAVLAWSPLASGWLSGAVREGREITTSRSALLPERFDLTIPANRTRLDAVELLAKVAAEADLTMIQLALGFVTGH